MKLKLPLYLLGIGKDKEAVTENKGLVRDAGVALAFVGAISVLLLVAGYVISRLSSDRAHREKWKDYNDCGWA